MHWTISDTSSPGMTEMTETVTTTTISEARLMLAKVSGQWILQLLLSISSPRSVQRDQWSRCWAYLWVSSWQPLDIQHCVGESWGQGLLQQQVQQPQGLPGQEDGGGRGVVLKSMIETLLKVERIGDFGSVLIIRDWDQRDTGIYRCLATRSYESSYSYRSAYGREETIYMEIDFTPRGRSYGGSRNEYSGYFSSRDDYRSRPNSNRDYGWFR